jgi:hypothetical protein
MIHNSDYVFIVDNGVLFDLCPGALDIEGWAIRNLSGLMGRVISLLPAFLHFDGFLNFTRLHASSVRYARIQCAVCACAPVIRAEKAHHEHFPSPRSTKRSSRLPTSAKCHPRHDKFTSTLLPVPGR